ncbi:hypothetical protein NVP1183O_23 [Vibrio phage 1.183.O._10N.286.48.B7]|nr:hypothetical protein NVP1183O_23 [Vibrio phage 1.183.O._10N.286.48.B7]
MWVLALNKLDHSKVKKGIAETVKKAVTWPPNLPKFIELCESIEDASESFYRFIAKKPPKDSADQITRNRVGFQCRTQLPEDKALKLWSETMIKVREGLANGEIKDIDLSVKRIETPEKMKETLTPEQHNQQLDRKIDEFLAKGIKLIGPFKTRYEERKNENR